jgi:hypothetical protein
VLARARRKLAEANRGHAGNRELYAGHRARLCRLVTAVQRGAGGLCVLGAGNGDDLDLPALARAFGEVHLVDLDGAAMERALGALDGAARARLRVHPDVDLSGVLADVETWADDLPDAAAWRERALPAASAITERIASRFDVVLSAGVVSQLCVPLYEVLAARPPEWAALMEAVGRIHVATMAQLLRPGGTGVLVGDFPCRGDGAAPAPSSWKAVPAAVRARLDGGVLSLRKPDVLAALVEATPGLADPRRTEPWPWPQPDGVSLAYGILFRHPGGGGGAHGG